MHNTRPISGVAVSCIDTAPLEMGFFVKKTVPIIVLALIAGIGYGRTWERSIQARPVTQPPLTTDAIWTEIQHWRMNRNLPTYIKDERVCAFAQRRLDEIKQDFSHDGFWNEPCPDCAHWAENLAMEYPTASEMITAWEESPAHLKNLEDPHYTHACVAYDSGYAVHAFTRYW